MRDLSTRVTYVSTQPKIASVSRDGLVKPAGDGSAAVRVSLGKIAAQARVTVAGSKSPAQISFMRDIVPILTQAGCNSLSCHGSPAGKNGFKLSMYGFEPPLDFDAITKQERTVAEKGKRIDPSAPEKSLFLLKPTMQVKHQGGMRFKPDSAEYRTLLAWLKAGAARDAGDILPTVARLEVLPAERVLPAAGEKQRLVVMALYSDWSVEDVTHKSIYASNDDGVARVDGGIVEAAGVGETAVLVRYLGRVGMAQFLVPQPANIAAKEYAGFKPANYIDGLALAKWKKLRFAPSDLCTDQEFLRRVCLDLTGTLPAPDEIRAFLAECAAERQQAAQGNGEMGKRGNAKAAISSISPFPSRARAKKIEALLAKPEYADWWTVFWGDILRNNSRIVQPNPAKAYHAWIRQSIVDNKPYDQFVRELITATGNTGTNGAANFYRVARTPAEQAEQAAQLFMGVRLQCANCHNHPFEKWTRSSYHQFAAIFAQITARGQNNAFEITSQPNRDYRHPETNQVMAPAVLDDLPREFPGDKDRREVLAAWLASPDNALFARNLVNRLWAQLLGRGIVEPVDDVRATNPPSNEPLLDALAKDFIARKFDVKHMLRTIANSRTYQLSVRANKLNEKDRQNFSRAYYRRLKAEALLDGVCQATNQPESFQGYPAGTRAIQLVDNRVASYFMDIFGRPRREVVCTCEREETANITQALHLINGNTLNSKISSDRGRVAELLKSGKGDREIIEEIYLWSLSRIAAPDEIDRALKQIAAAPDKKRQTLEDLMWALLNSREFLFNH
jgi:uncharacterized protein DUF1553/uncharacterized protein DUF1549/Big-like domain-containing protein